MPKQENEKQNDGPKVVEGDARLGVSVADQANEARGLDPKHPDQKKLEGQLFGEDKEAQAALEKAHPERIAEDIRKEARMKHLESLGIDPNAPSSLTKVELSGKVDKQFKGRLTLQSVHGETGHKISFVCEEAVPRGEEYMFGVMKNAHPHAMREHFSIDTENKSDPLLRTPFE